MQRTERVQPWLFNPASRRYSLFFFLIPHEMEFSAQSRTAESTFLQYTATVELIDYEVSQVRSAENDVQSKTEEQGLRAKAMLRFRLFLFSVTHLQSRV